jgi:hypothetical protein
MPVLITSRLTCSPLQEQDWPFFLALQQPGRDALCGGRPSRRGDPRGV